MDKSSCKEFDQVTCYVLMWYCCSTKEANRHTLILSNKRIKDNTYMIERD